MQRSLIDKFKNDPKMYGLLKQNSYWIKDLTRNPEKYKDFVTDMKEKYHLRVTDKISNAIDSIDLISTVIDTLK